LSKLRLWSAGKPTQLMRFTPVSELNCNVDKMVRPFKPKVPPIELSWSDVIAVNCVALLQVRSPVICCTPLIAICPAALESMMTSPLYVWQSAICAASADDAMVIDGPSHCAIVPSVLSSSSPGRGRVMDPSSCRHHHISIRTDVPKAALARARVGRMNLEKDIGSLCFSSTAVEVVSSRSQMRYCHCISVSCPRAVAARLCGSPGCSN